VQLPYVLNCVRGEHEPVAGLWGCCLAVVTATFTGRQSHRAAISWRKGCCCLQAMLATLQKQNRGLQAEVKRHRAAAAADEALTAEASQARAALAVCTSSCSTP
jgi:hypothetical protein